MMVIESDGPSKGLGIEFLSWILVQLIATWYTVSEKNLFTTDSLFPIEALFMQKSLYEITCTYILPVFPQILCIQIKVHDLSMSWHIPQNYITRHCVRHFCPPPWGFGNFFCAWEGTVPNNLVIRIEKNIYIFCISTNFLQDLGLKCEDFDTRHDNNDSTDRGVFL